MSAPMARVLEVPRLGEGLFEVRIVTLLKQPGDRVAEDEPIYVLESDKATLSIESPCAGILSAWRVAAGDVVRIGAPVAEVEPRLDRVPEPASDTPPPPPGERPGSAVERSGRDEHFVPPRTRAHARRLGVSAEELQAMARPGRRLTPEDVDRHLASRPGRGTTADPAPAVAGRPLTGWERTLIHRMRRSAEQVIPCTLTSRIRIDGLEQVGFELLRERGLDPESRFVSAFQIVAHAVAGVVRTMPRFRSRLHGDETCVEADRLDLGIAVHTPDDALVTAVVAGADRMDLVDFLDAFGRSVEEAMGGRDQVGPGTQMVLSNLGTSRVTGGTPLLVAPAVAVLAYGEAPHPASGNSERWATVSLTFDHRLIQGIHASRFLEALQDAVEVLRRREWNRVPTDRIVPSGTVGDPRPGGAAVGRVLAIASGLLGVPVERLDPVRSLATQGLDSLGAVTLAERLGRLAGVALPATWAWRHPNALAMARALDEARPGWGAGGVGAEVAGRTPGSPVTVEGAPPGPPAQYAAAVAGDPIAIVGVAFRLPGGIGDLDSLWELLARGGSAIGPVPSDRFVGEPDRDWKAGFVDGIDRFDAGFFQISPHEAERMDPQHRLFLETVWHALEDAGEVPGRLAGTRTGVFAAVSNQDYHGLHRDHRIRDAHGAIGVAPSLLANRVSYLLDLRGPSQTVDTACSGSLVALHGALRSMSAGDCDQALVGGVNLFATPDLFRSFTDAGMLAPDGRNRTFDAAATGYVRGEGVAAVLLKPLSVAIRDGNPIHAVIRGSAVNHGGRSASLTAPNPVAQTELLEAAWRSAGIAASDIGYIEAHGTGTPLGDPIEVEALTAAYRSASRTGIAQASCAIGSVKPNLGHLEAVAGLAGVLKMVACFRAASLPPSAELTTINPHLKIGEGPFHLVRERCAWPQTTGSDGAPLPRRAGVSSFGFGGANAHVVLEEPPGRVAPGAAAPGCLLLSARDPEALRRTVARLVGHLHRHPELPMPSLMETLRIGRTAWRSRLACLGGTIADVVRRLTAHLDGAPVDGVFVGEVSASTSGGVAPEPRAFAAGDVESQARAWVVGGIRWDDPIPGQDRPVRIPLPGYPFAGERHWIGDEVRFPEAQPTAPETTEVPGRLLALVPEWCRVDVTAPSSRPTGARWLVLGGDPADLAAVRALQSDVTWMPDVGTLSPEDLDVGTVLFLPPGGSGGRPGDAVRSAFQAVRVLLQSGHGSRAVRWISVTRGAEPWHWGDPVRLADAGLHGLVGTLAREYPDWDVTTVDLAPGDVLPVGALMALPRDPNGHPWLYRRGAWHRRRLVEVGPIPKPAPVFQEGDVHVVVGGAGGLGRLWTRHLIETTRARVVWLGRRAADDVGVVSALDDVSIHGCRPEYLRADVSDPTALGVALASVRGRLGRIDVVVHAAVAGMDQALGRMDEAAFLESFRAKVHGSRVLAEVVGEIRPGLVLFFSSMASLTTDHGKAAYAAATAFQDALASDLAGRVAFPVRVVDWGYWGEVGIGRSIPQSVKHRLHHAGFRPIPEAEAWAAVEAMVPGGPPRRLLVGAIPGIDLQGAVLDGVSWMPIDATTALRPEPISLDLPPMPNPEAHREIVALLETHLLGLLGIRLQTAGVLGTEWIPVAEVERRVGGPGHLQRWLRKVLSELRARGHLEEDRDAIRLVAGRDPVGGGSWSDRRTRLLADPCTAGWMRLAEMALGGLPEILSGRTAPTEVLFAGAGTAAVEEVYRGNPVADHFNEVLAEWVASRVAAAVSGNPACRIRILEIGAGTGATTRVVLRRLRPWARHIDGYTFTDVSRAFLNLAEEREDPGGVALEFKVLDVTRDPRRQGFAEGSYDLVVASNVLHATPDIRSTLRHAKALLRGGGMLAINEISGGSVAALLTFGLLEGWWLTVDPEVRIPGCPGLLPSAWRRLLVSEGLSPVFFPDPGSHVLGQQIVVGVGDGWVRPMEAGSPGVGDRAPVVEMPRVGPVVGTAAGERGVGRGDLVPYLGKVIGEILKIPPQRLDPDEPFETYGIDSILVMQLTNRLRRDFPEVKASLFFEARNIRGLAAQLPALAPDHPFRAGNPGSGSLGTGQPLACTPYISATGQDPGAASVVDAGKVPQPPPTGPEPIAIIGMSGLFPMASDLEAFWDNLVSGRDCVGEVPQDRWRMEGFLEPDRARAVREGRSYTAAGAFVDGFADFDPLFFGIPPVEALAMDPQERLFLEHSWRAMEDAGVTRETLAVRHDGRVGVFAGITSQGFAHHAPAFWSQGEPIHPVSPISSTANRVSYLFNLRGPSLPVDTMCSSSLTAVHLACDHLARGEVDLAFAGGVHLNLHPSGHVALCAKGMLSPTGRCRSFGRGADGFVPGEGVGVVLLKRLSMALADRDPIHAVIRGTHVNHGGRTQGYTVPNPHAQRELVCETLRRAGVESSTIGCVEAHGTGTELGDPIEVSALAKAFGPGVPGSRCALGSVKSNVGHLEAAAGIAGLVKVVLQLRHRTLVPTLHVHEVNPEIQFEGTPFFLPRRPVPWEPVGPGIPRRAGISSFGAGGANAHVVLEEAPAIPWSRDVEEPCLVLLSARTPKALQEAAARLLAAAPKASAPGTLQLRDVAHTLQVGREPMEERFGVVVATWTALRGALEGFLSGSTDGCGAVRSDRGPDGGALRLLEDDEDLRSAVDRLLERGRLDRLLILWLRGVRIDWSRLPSGPSDPPRRVPLPTYPFQRQRLWIPGETPARDEARVAEPPASDAAPGDLAFLARWQVVQEAGDTTPVPLDGAVWCVDLGAGPPPGGVMTDALRGAGASSVSTIAWKASWENADLDGVLPDPGSVRCIVCRVHPADPADGGSGDGRVWEFFRLVRWLRSRMGAARRVALWVVTADVHPRADPGSTIVEGAAVLGLAGSLAQSDRAYEVRLVDVPVDCMRRGDPAFWNRVLALAPSDRGEVLRWEGACFHRRVFLPVRPMPSSLVPDAIRTGGVYVIAGGAGSVGRAITRHLMRRHDARVVWLGRRPATSGSVQKALEAVGERGRSPWYLQVDVRDRDAMRRAVEEIRGRLGTIHGAVFSVVVSEGGGAVGDAGEEAFRSVLETKTTGSRVFQETLGTACSDFVCHFSSIQAFAFTSSRDSAAYAAGIAHADAEVRRAASSAGPAVGCIHWGYWRTFAEGTDLAARIRGRFGLIGDTEGAAFFDWFVGQLRSRLLTEVVAVHASETLREALGALFPAGRVGLHERGRVSNPDGIDGAGAGTGGGLDPVSDGLERFESILVRWMAASLRRIPGFDPGAPDRIPEGILPRYRRWWTECLAGLGRAGLQAGVGDEGWLGERERLLSDPVLRARIPLVEDCLAALPDILTGRLTPTDLLFPAGSLARVEGVYRDNPVADHYNAQVAGWVRQRVDDWCSSPSGAPVRLLEIGGGTGGTTDSILRGNRADGARLEYRFTDLSKAFLMGIEDRHGRDNPGLSTGILDISVPPAGQGFEPGSFDIVVATNVLHATPDIRSTVRNVRSLLGRGGVLVLNEVTRKTWFQFLTFGLLDGWWLFRDPSLRIPGSPVLEAPAWLQVLREEGLRVGGEIPGIDESLGQHVFVAESDGWVVHEGAGQGVPASVGIRPGRPDTVAAPRSSREGSVEDPDPVRRVELRLARVLGQTLRIPDQEVRRDMAFADYGIDSILTGTLVDRMREALGVPIGSTVLFEHGTVARLARHLVGIHGPGLGGGLPDGEGDAADPVDVQDREELGSASDRLRPVPAEASRRSSGGGGEGRSLDIAVIGLSGRFPGASDAACFWRNLAAGGESISELPHHYLPPGLHSAGEKVRGRAYSNRGGVLEDRDCFDPLFFRISPREAESMNPHQRLVLEEGWRALEDAAVDPRGLSGRPVGLFVGAEPSGYWHETLSGHSDAIVASRLSYHLNLTGPAFTVNTGCSSSAVALHLACRSLRDGETDLALAGGVFAAMDPRLLVSMSQIEMLSRSGSCRTFDASADGTVLSEGVGMLVLKRLEDAVADGDPIHGVIVGTGVNQDGASNGITAPNGSAQEELIVGVYQRHGIDPSDVTYIEAHGTATPLGDPVEANALVRAFRRLGRGAAGGGVCRVGSVKANIGHTAAAAAAVGLIKLLLALRHRTLPGLPNFHGLNPRIEFEGSPFVVCDRSTPWIPGPTGVRMASMNAFGHSGTNVHLVVREHPDGPGHDIGEIRWNGRPVGPGNPVVVPLSARTPEALAASALRLSESIRAASDDRSLSPPSIGEIAWTWQTGREPMECRAGCVAGDLGSLLVQLDRIAQGRDPIPDGSAISASMRALVDRWVGGEPVEWAPMYEGRPPRRIHLPTYPFARERYWMPSPGPVAVPMSVAPEGSGSTPVRLDWSPDDPVVVDHVVAGRVVVPAAFLLERVRAAAARHPALAGGGDVALAMEDVAWLRPVEGALRGGSVRIELEPVRDKVAFRIVSSVDEPGDLSTRIHATGVVSRPDGDAMVSVPSSAGPSDATWSGEDCLRRFSQAGLDYGPEFRRVARIDLRGDVAEVSFTPSSKPIDAARVLDPALIDAGWQGVVALVGQEVSGGLPFAVDRVEIRAPMHRVRSATVRRCNDSGRGVFRFDVVWREADGAVVVAMAGYTVRVPSAVPVPGPVFLVPGWERVGGSGGAAVGLGLSKLLKVFVIGFSHEWTQGFTAGLGDVACERMEVPGTSMPEGVVDVVQRLTARLREQWRPLSESGGGVAVVVPSAGGSSLLSGLQGLLRSVELEDPGIRCHLVEWDPSSQMASASRLLVTGPDPGDVPGWWRVTPDGFWRRSWQELPLPLQTREWKPREGGVYLVTGGRGGIAGLWIRHLARLGRRSTFVLVGRSVEGGEVPGIGEDGVVRVVHRRADVSDRRQVDRLVADVLATEGRLDGVFHAAGVTRDAYVVRKEPESIREVLAGKWCGAVHLDAATAGMDLDVFVLFSSMAAVIGNAGQSDYAAANGLLDGLARWRQELVERGDRRGRTLSVDWPLWREGGMRIDDEVASRLESRSGLRPLETSEGVRSLVAAMGMAHPQVWVLAGDVERLRAARFGWVRPGRVEDLPVLGPSAPGAAAVGIEVDRVVDLLRRRLAPVLRLDPTRLGVDEGWEAYGIDSILAMDLTAALEEVFGTLPRTLFFEYQTLRSLAGYFLRSRGERLTGLIAPDPGPGVVRAVEDRSMSTPAASMESPAPAPMPPAAKPGPASASTEIAIIGISGRYPGARDLEAFWRNLRDGLDCITEIPADRWDHRPFYDEDREVPGKTCSKWGGFIDGVAEFDPLYFNISPREAAILDPQERLFLQCAQEVAEDAGYTRAGFGLDSGGGPDREVGVFVGVMYEEYPLFGAEESLRGRPMALTGSPASIANRVSHFLDLRGPSFAVDTMCSSSLTAIHLACQSLMRGECRMAFAGGVNLSLHPNKYLMLGQGRFVSSKGRCESFGEGAEGYVPAEGVGAVLLKPLARAIEDGDRIHAVIRGTAVNHGGRTHGYTVPNPNAQARVIGRALDTAGVDARSIGYLEAHGTGTVLGDPIEIAGLAKAFSERTPDLGFCALGSVKSNIGHAESAAGIAALTKVVLQMRHRQIVPSLHARTLNPAIDFASTPFVVQQVLSDWGTSPGVPRRAGISSFGAGGGNAHIVVEEPPASTARVGARGVAALVLSARTPDQLRELARRLSVRLGDAGVDILDVAWTLQVGREAFEERLAFVATSREEARIRLARFADGDVEVEGVLQGNARRQRDSIAFLSDDEDMERTLSAWVSKGRVDRILDLWTRGFPVDWRRLSVIHGASRIGLPHYPFATERCWAPDPVPTQPGGTDRSPMVGPAPGWIEVVPRWIPMPGGSDAVVDASKGPILVLTAGGEPDLVDALRRRLSATWGVEVATVQGDGRPHPAWSSAPSACIDLTGLGPVGLPSGSWILGTQALAESAARRGIRWIGVTRGLDDSASPAASTAGAMQAAWCRLMSSEHPAIRSVHLDLEPLAGIGADVEAILRLLVSEDPWISYRTRGGILQRGASEAHPLDLSPGDPRPMIASDEVLWVTGGTRGLGALCAHHFIVRHGVRSVVLTGRDALPQRTEWDRLRSGSDPMAERIRWVESMESEGARVRVLALPLDDRDAVREARRQVEADWGRIGGVLHAAGLSDLRHPAWIRKPLESIAAVWSPKTRGLDVLLEVFRDRPPGFVVLFSSLSAAVPSLGAGLSDYAMANAYQDAVARAWHGVPRVLSIQWPLWGGSGSASGSPIPQAYLEAGFTAHADREGLDLLDDLLRAGRSGVVFPARVDPVRWRPETLQRMRTPSATRAGGHPAAGRVMEVSNETAAPSGADRRASATQWLRGVFATELRLDASRIEDDVPFADYGADSVLLSQVLGRIRDRIGSDPDPSLLLEHPTLGAAGRWLAGQASWNGDGNGGPTTEPPAPVAVRVASGLGESMGEPRPAAGRRSGIDDDIAVVGMSCRMPGAPDLGAFWDLLRSGRRAIGRPPEGRWATGSEWTGGWVDEVGWFDPGAFLVREEDARVMDPQAFLLLEEAVRTLCDAGYGIEELRRRPIGVYVGGRSRHVPDEALLARSRNPIRAAGPNYLAANVSQFLDWQGPSLVVDTACSSALVALQMAVQALRTGEVEAAWVAGVGVLDSDAAHRLFASRGILAPDGEFHVFDARAAGVIPAEGVGGILLKTAGRARADGDRIHAVIRGIAVNNDGRTAGPATPNPEAQREVLHRALDRSGIPPGSVRHIEVNGSGSEVTDLLELKAIQSVYRPRGGDPCSLGSVKPNLGHPLAAEGIAALIKVVLMVREGVRVPFLSGQEPMRHFDLGSTPFQLPREATEWLDPVRRAAVNCFADGGTNVHVLVESPAPAEPGGRRRPALPVPTWNRRPWMSSSAPVGAGIPMAQERPVDAPTTEPTDALSASPDTPSPWRFQRAQPGAVRMNRWRRPR